MEGFKERLVKEAEDLSEKYIKLKSFIEENGKVYQSLSNADQGLLIIQKNAMLTYLSVLNTRISQLELNN